MSCFLTIKLEVKIPIPEVQRITKYGEELDAEDHPIKYFRDILYLFRKKIMATVQI